MRASLQNKPKRLDTLERRPPRGGRQRKPRKWIVMGLTAIVLVGSGFMLSRFATYQEADSTYQTYRQWAQAENLDITQTAQERYASPIIEGETVDGFKLADFKLASKPDALVERLLFENHDTVAWLDIPNTKIQYPVVQGTDNTYYSQHTIQRKKSAAGAIFMDCNSQADFSGFNTVIYGHNMRDGSMFATLDEYTKQSFMDKHATIHIRASYSRLEYRVFAVYTVPKGAFDFCGHTVSTEEEKREMIKAIRKKATNYSSQSVAVTDRLLTLVTCSDGRDDNYVVLTAVLVNEVKL